MSAARVAGPQRAIELGAQKPGAFTRYTLRMGTHDARGGLGAGVSWMAPRLNPRETCYRSVLSFLTGLDEAMDRKGGVAGGTPSLLIRHVVP